eukprot:CAMPEP_0175061944 /NCGR_PEP_ID=MMETSP0052_2-20121109/13873_1 /TAXON_ID=51329 ORGANISM="Polytomella parva, Strain SAG 63-3" /NCGR_SAMPLE_ID=MMETSP0052_2 /ASSEMBLY_ACC=CAM_ASM_000194 /LENGTH=128 /DNA_ID=CAMNT_0016327869 /DNA_START=339 /DNA_END=722 /DNA_ORIENTATION=+
MPALEGVVVDSATSDAVSGVMGRWFVDKGLKCFSLPSPPSLPSPSLPSPPSPPPSSSALPPPPRLSLPTGRRAAWVREIGVVRKVAGLKVMENGVSETPPSPPTAFSTPMSKTLLTLPIWRLSSPVLC